MIIDVHTHIFPKKMCHDRAGFFEKEDAFRLLYESPKSRMVDAESLIAAMDEAGVDMAVTFGFPWRQPGLWRMHNDYIMDAATRYPKRLIPLCCVDMAAEGAAEEITRCLAAGCAGAGELAFYASGLGREAIALLEPVMASCRAANAPIMIHTNEPVGHFYPGKTPVTPGEIYGLASAFPENKLILAHWGGGLFFYHLLKKEAADVLKNVYYDTAASPFLYDPKIYRIAIDIMGPDKILMGTDYPLIKPERYFTEMDRAGLSADEKARILGINAAELFSLSPVAA
ncbi:MAG: amidohydrolase [Desulfobacteraceae bacterium]|nr:MAG: amidohydrolase [Desulfobacteraceae bacterium]